MQGVGSLVPTGGHAMLELTKLSVGGATPEQQSELSAKLVEVNQYYLDRINTEWVEG